MRSNKLALFPFGVFLQSIGCFLSTFGFGYTLLPQAALVMKNDRPFWVVVMIVGLSMIFLGMRMFIVGAMANIAKALSKQKP